MNAQILSKKNFKDSIQTNIQISAKNKTMISIHQVERIISKYREEGANNIIVRGLNIDRWTTLKAFGGELDVDGLVDYYQNKVSDHEKYVNFYQLQLSVFMPK